MKIRRIFLFGTLACMFCVFPGCKDSDDVGENYTTFTGETVSDFLQDNEEYSAFWMLSKLLTPCLCWSLMGHIPVLYRITRRWGRM